MKKLLLTLLSMPTVVGAFLPLTSPANAIETKIPSKQQPGQFCMYEHGKMYCVRQTRPDASKLKQAKAITSNYEQGLTFTDKDSDMAIAKFGCDCPACIRAIKGMQAFTAS
jgi:hypothetical protein